MRIITGSARGKRLQTPAGDHTRPTPERVKEALFSAIQFEIAGRRFLDLFAGSGQMGLEALSRGAREAVFVEAGKEAASVIEKNIAVCAFERESKLLRMYYLAFFARNQGLFDLAFLDPPYQSGLLWNALEKTTAIMQPGGTIICEHPLDMQAPESRGSFEKKKTYRYGKIALTFYRHKDGETE